MNLLQLCGSTWGDGPQDTRPADSTEAGYRWLLLDCVVVAALQGTEKTMTNGWLKNDANIMTSEQSDTNTLPQGSVHMTAVNVNVLIAAINMAEVNFGVLMWEASILPEPGLVRSQFSLFYLMYIVRRQREAARAWRSPVYTAQLQCRAIINPAKDSLTLQQSGFEALACPWTQ